MLLFTQIASTRSWLSPLEVASVSLTIFTQRIGNLSLYLTLHSSRALPHIFRQAITTSILLILCPFVCAKGHYRTRHSSTCIGIGWYCSAGLANLLTNWRIYHVHISLLYNIHEDSTVGANGKAKTVCWTHIYISMHNYSVNCRKTYIAIVSTTDISLYTTDKW